VSRVGKVPITVPSGVDVKIGDGLATVKGPNGTLEVLIHKLTKVEQEGDQLSVKVENPDDQATRAAWGLTRALVANAVEGVVKGFEKRLVVVGIGYRAEIKGNNLDLQVGYSHNVPVTPPHGIEFALDDPPGGIEGAQTTVIVKGASKELVGSTAADIRKVRPPEPYKGKGIRYADEYVRRKAGKTAIA
jgi:large subunit ribosomal protein L6